MEPIQRSGAARKAAVASQLHPASITDRASIRQILLRALDNGTRLSRGFSRRIEPEYAVLEAVGTHVAVLNADRVDVDAGDIAFLSFTLDGASYFFTADVIRRRSGSGLEIAVPTALYRGERRSRQRVHVPDVPISVELSDRSTRNVIVVDQSPEGLAIEVSGAFASFLATDGKVLLRDERTRQTTWGFVRNSRPAPVSGWTRLGLELSPAPVSDLRCEIRGDLDQGKRSDRFARSVELALGAAQVVFDRIVRSSRPQSHLEGTEVVDIFDAAGRRIRALTDSWGGAAARTAVVIPPAWGRTKETLMPLAATIVASFKHARRPISVLRFDGINRRGESFRDPDCAAAGHEHDHFTFTQGVRDLSAVINYLHSGLTPTPLDTIIVSFSAASIEARRVVATDARVTGWVCVVGSADLQSMMKAISGGIDYALGAERGVKFGMQEILGVGVDMDLAGADALRNELAYMSDARRDMAKISVPVTWIRGQHDAWMDGKKVRDALEVGDTSRRKLIEVPTGHMLKTSREALAVFELVAREVSGISQIGAIPSRAPRLVDLDRRRQAEARRLERVEVDLKRFWEDYLLGRDRTIGSELMTLTSAYGELMALQIDALAVRSGECVIDLGAGTGAFPFYLWKLGVADVPRVVVEVDFVRNGLRRARSRVVESKNCCFVEANIDIGARFGSGIPVAANSADAVLASLFLSYVADPRLVLREIRRILKAGGRLVVSTLRRDADMSKLFVDGVSELRPMWSSEGDLAAWAVGIDFDRAIRGYMNEASRLLDLEEAGRFSFWDEGELRSLLVAEGFEDIGVHRAFGDPTQAIVGIARCTAK